MKATAVAILAILWGQLSIAQHYNRKNISLSLCYPKPVGNSFVSKGLNQGYSGTLGINGGYSIISRNNLGIELTAHSALLKQNQSETTLTIFGSRINSIFTNDFKDVNIVGNIGIGYSHWIFRSPDILYLGENNQLFTVKGLKMNYNAASFSVGSKVILWPKNQISTFVSLNYEFFRLEKPDEPIENNNFNRNIQLLYPGVGLIYRFWPW